jgi:hypothetical protein
MPVRGLYTLRYTPWWFYACQWDRTLIAPFHDARQEALYPETLPSIACQEALYPET